MEWLGHRDLCSIQWSSICDCDDPIDLAGTEVGETTDNQEEVPDGA